MFKNTSNHINKNHLCPVYTAPVLIWTYSKAVMSQGMLMLQTHASYSAPYLPHVTKQYWTHQREEEATQNVGQCKGKKRKWKEESLFLPLFIQLELFPSAENYAH